MKSIYQQLVNVTMVAQMICLFVLTLKLPPAWKIKSHEWTRWVILSFSLAKIVMVWVLFVSDEHPGDSVVRVCKNWLDAITNLAIAVPSLAVADFSTGAWLVFLGLHISASTPFFVKWLNYSIPLAVFKVFFIQGLSLLAYAAMEQSKFKAYMRYLEHAHRRKLATHKDAPSPVGSSALYGEPTIAKEASAGPSTEQSIGSTVQALLQHKASAHPSTEEPRGSNVKELHQPAQDPRFSPYVSRFKKTKVLLKIHCNIEPEDLLTSPNINQLPSLLKLSLPGSVMVESAVRHGCVVVSVDLCEPVRFDDEASLLSSNATEHEVARKVAGSILEWLHASDAQSLKHGTVLSIQVKNLVFRGCWNASTCSVQLFEDQQAVPPTKEHCSITLSEPAILLPALQPEQQQRNSSVSFVASVSTPAKVKLVGWQNKKSASRAVEGVQMGEEGVVLQLLASARGMFLPIEVSRAADKEHTVQVCISLPASFQMDGQCFRMKLELVRGDMLLCGRSVLLMDSHLKEEQQELKGWAVSNAHTPESVSVYLEDLAEFLSFQGLSVPSSVSPSIVEGSVSSRSSNLAHPQDGLLPLLKVEARTPEMLHMMAEVGLELLQHAVSWGMAALAQRLLTGLISEPLHLPFHALACGQLPKPHPFAEEGVQQQQQQQQQQRVQEQQKELGDAAIREPAQQVQPPALSSGEIAAASDTQSSGNAVQGKEGAPPHPCSSRSLITCALLSYNKQCLARVMEWGRTYGGGPCGYAWPWDVVDGSGYSPIQIIASLPVGHAVLEQLLADPTASGALQQEAHRDQPRGPDCRVPGAAGQAGQACRVRGHQVHHQAHQHQPGSGDPLAEQGAEFSGDSAQAGSGEPPGRESAAVKCCAMSPPASSPTTTPQHAYPNGVLRSALKALVFGFGKHGGFTESDYREWCFESTAGYANMWCRIVIFIFSYTVLKCLYNGMLFNAVIVSFYPIPMFLALCANTTKKRKVYMTIGKVILWTLLLMFSMGVLPSVLYQKLTILHLDWPVEVLMFRLMDQAQLGALLLERAISCVSNTHMYAKLGFSFPLSRALTLSLCSLLVGVILDVRNRCIFLKIQALSAAGMHPKDPMEKCSRC